LKLIRAIFSDNEGCILPGKGQAFPLLELDALRSFLRSHPAVGFGICTGRSVPYVEAMVHALDLIQSPVPCICEGGASLYWPQLDTWEATSPLLDKVTLFTRVAVMKYREELGKVGCLSLYPDPPTTVEDLFRAYTDSPALQGYQITRSVAAVDITRVGVDKAFGVKKACLRLGVDVSQVLCIGDALNDVPMLEAVGFSACHANATNEVKEIVDFAASGHSTVGMLEILRYFSPYFNPPP
jgi:hydroxymethylpyrimidine pyrophosphatase-like HAD family hydrolase